MKPSATLVTTLSTLLLWACMPGFTRCSDTPLALAPANNHAACSLNIDRVVVGDCEYGARTGFRSKIIVAVFLSWSMPVPGEKI
ncbi:MAG TPA: hypothetical protein VFX48_08805, partial [Saprospiraceae bacterium]|nr:hypothetical protein [Saprospiraceae bacterium]